MVSCATMFYVTNLDSQSLTNNHRIRALLDESQTVNENWATKDMES